MYRAAPHPGPRAELTRRQTLSAVRYLIDQDEWGRAAARSSRLDRKDDNTPVKTRTRQHMLADLTINYVGRQALVTGRHSDG
jgi:hypothetical protein